jgi:hypothetical protein
MQSNTQSTFHQAVAARMGNARRNQTTQVTILPATRMNRMHGYVEHEVVRYKGQEIGRIQTRVERGEMVVLTISDGRTKRGRDVEWLVRTYQSTHERDAWLGQKLPKARKVGQERIH